ncbi:MAG TPA: hypothetical protein VHA33_09325 [Candidatus Angelobacter sp.]|nr:hypothetical protein [Candidatus Angelobacter sp.]
MIRTQRSRAAICAILFLLLTAVAPNQTKQRKSPSSTKTVTGRGCVGPGVEERCILLTDTATHTLYNLYFKGKRPILGSTIQFTGKSRNGPTSCMQGQPVDVTKWTKLDNSCSAR